MTPALDSVEETIADPVAPRPLFDDVGLFDWLERHPLPALIDARRATGRRLRIWSAACDGGGEAWTLGLLLQRLLPDLADWQPAILASDGDPRWFPQPRTHLFDDAAMARVPQPLRLQGFRRAPGGHWSLAASLRRLVEFAHIDLQADAVPSLLTNAHALDLILCRGLLPRLTTADAAQVVDKLLRALAPGGWLIVDGEHAVDPPDGIEHRGMEGLQAWVRTRPCAAADDEAIADAAAPDPAAGYARALIDYRQGRYADARRLLQQAARTAPKPARMLALLARVEAVQGRVDDARAWAELAVAADDLDPAGHCLRACILQAQGTFGEAMQAFQRALYLDPGFMLAHFGLGSLARRLGRFGEAERHYSNALALARGWPPEAALPHADGLTAGRLARIIEAMRPDSGE